MSEFDLLITNARIYTADSSRPVLNDAAIVIDQGQIQWLGNTQQLPEHFHNQATKHIAKPPGWLTPGFIDCHTHLVYGGNRSDEFRRQLEGESYQSIAASGGGILSTVKATRQASEEELYQLASKRLGKWLAQGVTHIEIKSGYGLDLDSERKMLRVARRLSGSHPVGVSTTLLAAHALPPEFNNKDDYITHICSHILPACHDEGLVDAVDGFCESIAFSRDQIQRLFQTAINIGLPVKLHAEQLSNQNGSGLAASMGALSVDHLEYLAEPDIELMAQNNTVAVLLPAAYYFLQETKLPPINDLRKHKIPIAIATDHNPGSAPVMSLTLVMNMACRLFGLHPEEALAAVTIQAARALGIQNCKGSLEVGKQADIVCWPIENLTDLSYYFGAHEPDWVIQAGKLQD